MSPLNPLSVAPCFAPSMLRGGPGGRRGKIHRADPKFAGKPSSLTENPYIRALALTQTMGHPCEFQVAGPAADKVNFTGRAGQDKMGQLQQSLVGILSQTAGSTGKLWANPENSRATARRRAHARRSQHACRRLHPRCCAAAGRCLLAPISICPADWCPAGSQA